MRDDAPDRYVKRIAPRLFEAMYDECRANDATHFQTVLSLLVVRTFEAGTRYERKRIDAVREVSE